MKARVDNIEVEGTTEELIEFVARWTARQGSSQPTGVKTHYGSDPTGERDYEKDFKFPCTHPGCRRRFASGHGRAAHLVLVHKEQPVPPAPAPSATEARPWEAQNPFACPNCPRRFPTERGLDIHRHYMHKAEVEKERARVEEAAAKPDPPRADVGREEYRVLSRLYDLPTHPRDYAQRGKTALTLSKELDVDRREMPKILAGLVNKQLAIVTANAFSPAEPFYFRRVR